MKGYDSTECNKNETYEHFNKHFLFVRSYCQIFHVEQVKRCYGHHDEIQREEKV